MTRGNFGDATSLGEHALRLSRRRKLTTATLLQQLALRPEFVAGVELGALLIPEALRHPGQWVVRSEDLLSFHLELTNLHVASGVEGGRHRRLVRASRIQVDWFLKEFYVLGYVPVGHAPGELHPTSPENIPSVWGAVSSD